MKDDEHINEFVDRVEECWIRLGLEVSVRRRLVRELVVDLAAARSAGACADDLVRTDVVAFAIELARADGQQLTSRHSRPTLGPLIATALVGGDGRRSLVAVSIPTTCSHGGASNGRLGVDGWRHQPGTGDRARDVPAVPVRP